MPLLTSKSAAACVSERVQDSYRSDEWLELLQTPALSAHDVGYCFDPYANVQFMYCWFSVKEDEFVVVVKMEMFFFSTTIN